MNNTIFDDVFRTFLEKMPEYIIPVINQAFGTSYPIDSSLQQERNEHHGDDGEVITDSCFTIENRVYHIECQSTPDGTMAVRMVEYDFMIALERAEKNGHDYTMEFPRSCVLYLRHNKNTPDALRIKIVSDGESITRVIPIIKVQDYVVDDIFAKNLLLFLPYYILKYEENIENDEIIENAYKYSMMINDYREIYDNLEIHLSESNHISKDRILELIRKVSDYVFKQRNSKKVKERIDDIMGGAVLELEIDKAIEKGEKIGIEKGIEKGIEQAIFDSVAEGDYPLERGAEKMKISVEEFKERFLNSGRKLI